MRCNSPPAPRGRRSDGEARREAILDAAAELFAEHGFDRSTTRQIAARADCNIAAIRYYFRDKSGLLAAVIERTIASVAEGGRHPTIPSTDEPREALKDWIVWVLKTGRRRQEAGGLGPRLIMQGLAVRGQTARVLAARLGAPVRANIYALIDQVLGPSIPSDIRDHAFVFIFSLCSQFAHGGPILENMGIAVPEDDDALDRLAERLTNFVIGGLHCLVELDASRRQVP